jgi:hypothetical protein
MQAALIRYDAACRAVAECKAVDEVKDWRDKAAALQAYARQAKNKQLEVDSAEIRIRAERRLGQMLQDAPKNTGAAGVGPIALVTAEGNQPPKLSDLGISYDLSSRAQQIASIPDEEFEQTLAEHRAEQQAVTGRTMERLASRAHVANNSGENEWYTPPQFVEAARMAMGGIDLDPASCALANETVKASAYFDMQVDGLQQSWSGRVWMNPPYAQPLIQQFCAKVAEEFSAGRIASACVLVNNGTETAWGQSLLAKAAAVCFPASRIKFIDKEGRASGAPLQGQMIVYLGDAPAAFRANFSQFGIVLNG